MTGTSVVLQPRWSVGPVRFSFSLARWAGVALFAIGPLIAGAAALWRRRATSTTAALGRAGRRVRGPRGVTAVAPARTWWIVALPVVAMALIGSEVAAGGVDEAHRWRCCRCCTRRRSCACGPRCRPSSLRCRDGGDHLAAGRRRRRRAGRRRAAGRPRAGHLGRSRVRRPTRRRRPRARVAGGRRRARTTSLRCLEEHVIGGEIVAAGLAIVDGEPPTLAEWVADAGLGAWFPPGRTIRVGPRDVMSLVAISGAVEVDIAGDTGAAAESRRRGYASALALGLSGPDGVVVGALVLGGRSEKSFRGRRRDRLQRTAGPLADAVTVDDPAPRARGTSAVRPCRPRRHDRHRRGARHRGAVGCDPRRPAAHARRRPGVDRPALRDRSGRHRRGCGARCAA